MIDNNHISNNYTQRLDKYLANAGYCARRKVADYLKNNQVTINQRRVLEPGTRFDPQQDKLIINDQNVSDQDLVYFIVNKPIGVVSTVSDEHNRQTVLDLLPKSITQKYRLYPVGRLDQDSHGLVLLTNDGQLTYTLTHPKNHIPKTYLVKVAGKVKAGYLQLIRRGIDLKHFRTQGAEVEKVKVDTDTTTLKIALFEGKNRQIRRMCKALNLELIDLQRISIGPLNLDNLQPGEYRQIKKFELQITK